MERAERSGAEGEGAYLDEWTRELNADPAPPSRRAAKQ
jgi:hypothetical protein